MKASKFLWYIVAFVFVIFAASLGKVGVKRLVNKFITPDVTSKEFLSEVADKMNKEYKVPFMVDKETQLTHVSAEKRKIIYQYIMVNYKADDLKKNNFISNMKNSITPKVCKHDRLIIHLKEGVSFIYSYYGKDGDLIGVFSVTPEECGY